MDDWSNLAQEAKDETLPKGPRCQVQDYLELIPESAADKVRAALEDRTVTTAGLARALRHRSGDDAPGPWSIGNHRRGGCRCGR